MELPPFESSLKTLRPTGMFGMLGEALEVGSSTGSMTLLDIGVMIL